ncbi:8-oxo-dGTP diphosphatase [Natrialbaceae archaeon AArc-T1-2]|uniref:8-oxo-dGTP diphosphatase n=1 Tax=Natrialbaceae archaeon AArc-T1-2 TaxID=3053904 RepID=UPI00255B0E09|nr:8-oxo-dGTP diphosphatase [Natrialbaceae archaeon AArc-T1-2]WIV68592.1 8-oxo-dGTP diphosphatase [Natrialbaceae archaeon AArc-T1-2]
MIEATLCFVVRDDEVLLIEKRRGLGEGWYNGPGGKLETGETPRECARREVREEVGLEVTELEKAGELTFYLDGDAHTHCHVFRTDSFAGEPTPSTEARPEWVPIEDVPYEQMWEDDRLWLPGVLDGRTVTGTFHFEGGEPLDEADFVESDLEWGVWDDSIGDGSEPPS